MSEKLWDGLESLSHTTRLAWVCEFADLVKEKVNGDLPLEEAFFNFTKWRNGSLTETRFLKSLEKIGYANKRLGHALSLAVKSGDKDAPPRWAQESVYFFIDWIADYYAEEQFRKSYDESCLILKLAEHDSFLIDGASNIFAQQEAGYVRSAKINELSDLAQSRIKNYY